MLIAHRKQNPPALFIIARGSEIRDVLEKVEASDFRLYDIQGVYLTDHADEADIPDEITRVSGEFTDYILSHNINEVLISLPPSELDADSYQRLVNNGATIYFDIDDIAKFHPEEAVIRTIGILHTLCVSDFTFTASQSFYLGLKRLLDLIFGTIGCILLLPLWGMVKLAYLISGDKAPVIFRQTRVGKDGKLIRIFKFRSMVPNAEAALQELLKEEPYRSEWEENQKLTDDPRITKVGKFLRMTSADELPQVINILKGDMSLVGPRPLVAGELEKHNGLKLYQKVRPGITGWWGCNGRSNISYNERLELEYYYVRNVSLYLDILCVFRTVYSVIRKDGAK